VRSKAAYPVSGRGGTLLAISLLAFALAACGTVHPPRGDAGATGTASAAKTGSPATSEGFAGYKWAVTMLAHDSTATPVTKDLPVTLYFAPDGQFVADEPINTHGGTYKQIPGGFTTGSASPAS
jgi:hypothetical protein